MRLLVLGGTRFLGPPLVNTLVQQGHSITVFHRGRSHAPLPTDVRHRLGDRRDLAAQAAEFRRLAPHVVLDLIAFTEAEAAAAVQAFRGVAGRLVVVSSMDVYRAYDRFRRVEPGPPDPVPLGEEAPLRSRLYPYRGQGKGSDDLAQDYEKILVERAVWDQPDLPATILRLPCVYGPGDYQHRTFEYLKRMDDGRRVILLGEHRAGWRWTRGYVEDVALAIALAATDLRAAGRVYNVGEQPAASEAEWVRAIGRAAGWTGAVQTVPEERLPAHLQSPYDWAQDLVGETTRLRQELGYRETVTREEALVRTVAWERSHASEPFDPRSFDYAAEDAALRASEAG
jgi:nucleoside-diphosphate-sugar epimerase